MEVRQPVVEMAHLMHRRKSGANEDANLVLLPNGDLRSSELQNNRLGHMGTLSPPPPPRNRARSSSSAQIPRTLPLPSGSVPTPPSAGPYRTNYGSLSPRAPSGPNGHSSSPFRSTFGHARLHSRAGSMSGQGLFYPRFLRPFLGHSHHHLHRHHLLYLIRIRRHPP